MKTLAKRLKASQRKNRELVKTIEGMVRANNQAERLIHNRDLEVEKLRAQLLGSTRYIYAMANLIGEEFVVPFDLLNAEDSETHKIKLLEDGLLFVKKEK